jgi:hypothetical protein
MVTRTRRRLLCRYLFFHFVFRFILVEFGYSIFLFVHPSGWLSILILLVVVVVVVVIVVVVIVIVIVVVEWSWPLSGRVVVIAVVVAILLVLLLVVDYTIRR